MSGAKTTLRILELARVLTLAWAIQKGSSVWKVCVLEKGLTIKRLGSSNRFFEPPLASKMHSHLVEPARVLALSHRIQKRPLKRGLYLYGGGIGIRTLVRLLT